MMPNLLLKHETISLPDDLLLFDGDEGRSVTLGELAQRRSAAEANKFQKESRSISDLIREENREMLNHKFEDLLNEEYDEEFLAPTEHILEGAIQLIYSINDYLGYEMPIPLFVIPDGEGGIRIEWQNMDKHLRLSLGEGRIYLYFEDNSQYDAVENFDAKQLVEKLKWLVQ